MESFASRKKLIKKTNLEYLGIDGWPILHLEEPALLARFAAQLMQLARSGGSAASVYSRGQATHYGRMPPSFFRDAGAWTVARLRAAEEALAVTVRDAFPLKRF